MNKKKIVYSWLEVVLYAERRLRFDYYIEKNMSRMEFWMKGVRHWFDIFAIMLLQQSIVVNNNSFEFYWIYEKKKKRKKSVNHIWVASWNKPLYFR